MLRDTDEIKHLVLLSKKFINVVRAPATCLLSPLCCIILHIYFSLFCKWEISSWLANLFCGQTLLKREMWFHELLSRLKIPDSIIELPSTKTLKINSRGLKLNTVHDFQFILCMTHYGWRRWKNYDFNGIGIASSRACFLRFNMKPSAETFWCIQGTCKRIVQ